MAAHFCPSNPCPLCNPPQPQVIYAVGGIPLRHPVVVDVAALNALVGNAVQEAMTTMTVKPPPVPDFFDI